MNENKTKNTERKEEGMMNSKTDYMCFCEGSCRSFLIEQDVMGQNELTEYAKRLAGNQK